MKKTMILDEHSEVSVHSTRTNVNRLAKWIRQNSKTFIGSLIVLLSILISVFAPWIAPYDPNIGEGSLRLAPPGTPGHLLGLDDQGRDVLSRLIYGGRFSLISGIVPIVLAAIASIGLGLIAGFLRGKIGELIMRFLDILFAFPSILIAITVAAILKPGMWTIVLTIILALIPYMTRIVYAAVLEEKEKEYIEAARVLGASKSAILFQELLPNILTSLVVYATTLVGSMIAFAAGLSFLGLGIQPPESDWGKMTSDGVKVLTQGAPHLALIPGLLIMVVSLGFNWLGDGLRDYLDPHHVKKDK